MKLIRLPLLFCITILLFSVLVACGADDIKYKNSDHWKVSLQRSTGSYVIDYVGNETHIKNFKYEITGKGISQEGKALQDQTTPFDISGKVTDSEKSKDPIEFKISWNNRSEIVTFE